jgi:hypothetical protein
MWWWGWSAGLSSLNLVHRLILCCRLSWVKVIWVYMANDPLICPFFARPICMWATKPVEFDERENNQEYPLPEPYYPGRESETCIWESSKRRAARTGVIVVPYYVLPDYFEFRSAEINVRHRSEECVALDCFSERISSCDNSWIQSHRALAKYP